jgi:hypothetical protein
MSTTLSSIDKEFADLGAQFYPGSTKPIVRNQNRNGLHTQDPKGVQKYVVAFRNGTPHKYAVGDWDAKPRKYVVAGVSTEFFTVGNLASALGRQAVTIRKWEREGVIPKSTYQSPGRDDDPRGRRRLYTREQVEGIVKIAAEEGVLVSHQKPLSRTQFSSRVIDLFKRLAEQ